MEKVIVRAGTSVGIGRSTLSARVAVVASLVSVISLVALHIFSPEAEFERAASLTKNSRERELLLERAAAMRSTLI